MSSPKVYFITKDGKFYNSKDKMFYSNIVNANYDKNKKGIEFLVENNPFFKGCEIEEVLEEDLFFMYQDITVKAVLAGSYFSELLVSLDMRLPTISQVGKNMHKMMNNAINALKPITSHYKDFLKKEEDRTDEIMGHYGEFIQNISEVHIDQMKEYNKVFRVMKTDKKSIVGLADKILKNRNYENLFDY